MWMSVQDLGIN